MFNTTKMGKNTMLR